MVTSVLKAARKFSVSTRTMTERIRVACTNISVGKTFESYINIVGGPKCSYDLKYLPNYTIGVKLNSWLTQLYSER